MPIYEYCCQDCKQIFEEWQEGFEERDMTCPVCSGAAKRVISHTAFILKGSGWYVTDYAGRKSGGNGDGKNGNGSKPEASESSADASADPSTNASAGENGGASKAGKNTPPKAPKPSAKAPQTKATRAD